jgi:hypothetical protein
VREPDDGVREPVRGGGGSAWLDGAERWGWDGRACWPDGAWRDGVRSTAPGLGSCAGRAAGVDDRLGVGVWRVCGAVGRVD